MATSQALDSRSGQTNVIFLLAALKTSYLSLVTLTAFRRVFRLTNFCGLVDLKKKTSKMYTKQMPLKSFDRAFGACSKQPYKESKCREDQKNIPCYL